MGWREENNMDFERAEEMGVDLIVTLLMMLVGIVLQG
jgi:hypothetical protein